MLYKNHYNSLVCEGGGVMGYSYCGSFLELENKGILNSIENYAGTSVGSLFVTLLVLGFTVDEIIMVKDQLDFSKINTSKNISFMFNLIFKRGGNDLNVMEKQIRRIIEYKESSNITLKELYEKTGKELVIVTCCLNKRTPLYLHHSQFPNVKLIEALLSSIAVPYIFKPRKYDFLGQKDTYIDGGVVDNYPLWVFNDIGKLYSGDLSNVNKTLIPSTTLGLKILSDIELHTPEMHNVRDNISGLYSLSKNIMKTISLQIEREALSLSYFKQTIPIKNVTINAFDFKITKAEIKCLIELGKQAVQDYFVHFE